MHKFAHSLQGGVRERGGNPGGLETGSNASPTTY